MVLYQIQKRFHAFLAHDYSAIRGQAPLTLP